MTQFAGVEARFWAKVDRRGPNGCWPWMGGVSSAGYGSLSTGGRKDPRVLAHRLAYELAHGPIPAGLTVDHLCHDSSCTKGTACEHRRCVNPSHLGLATKGENSRRGAHPKYIAHANGTCVQGHPQTAENVRVRADGTRHSCRICDDERSAAYNAARRARYAADTSYREREKARSRGNQ